jgi:Carboxypeptidase regulatory-like domain/TonB-dependent Receptor Plug Domain
MMDKMGVKPRYPLFVLIASLAFSLATHGQVVTAAISGKVEDPSGAGVSGATVTVKSVETGATRIVTTDDGGNFKALALPLGPQEVKAEKTGFRAQVRTGIKLEVGQEAVVNLQLQLGDIIDRIEVSEAIPVVNTTTSSVSGLVGERAVKDLPLNGRSFDNLITLNPGAINYSSEKSLNTSTSNGNTFSVAGRRPSDNLFLMNGIEYTGASQLAVTPGGVSGELLGIDAIREFNVLTDTYPAEYGKRSGAQVMVVTQSGTNVLHGSLFEFLRNSALDARNFFDQGSAPPFRRNQFGGALGGPLKKNRLFLFGNYEGFRQALAVSNVSVVPDSQARLGSLPNAAGIYAPVANLNPKMLPYMSFWPQANGAELLANGIPSGTALGYFNPKENIREDFGTLRTDYLLRERDSLSAAYTIDDGNSLIPLADPLFGSTTTLRMQVGSIEETHVFSPRMLNTFRVGFSRAAFSLDSSLLSTFSPSLSFVNGEGPGGIVVGGGATTTGLATITSAGPNNAAGVWNRRNLYTVTDNFQINKGRHQLSFGVWLQRMQDNEDTASRQLGVATFASLTTFLQGTVTTFQVVPDANELGWRSLFGAWYAEDTIKLRRNLTLQVGIRHEFTTGYNEESGRAANYITDGNGVLETNPRVASSAFTQNNAKLLFAPRIGLAWDPFGNGKTAVRAGFGTYYSVIDALSFQLNSVPPTNGSVSYSNVSLFSTLPVTPGVPPAPQCSPTVPAPCTTFAPVGVQPDAKTPTVEEWNFTIEQQLDHNTSLRVSYVGSHGYHGLLSVDPNSIPAQICASTTCTAGGTPGTTKSTVAQGAQYIPVGSRPNPYLGAGFFWYTEGNSSYNALETDITRRLNHGLEVRANYTWSKNLDMNSGPTGAQAQNQAQMILNRNDLPLDWGPSALNVTSQASISARYALPVGKTSKLFGGWQVNGIATLLTGFPFTPLVGSNRSGDGDTRNPDRPSLNPAFSGPIILNSPNQWFNPNAFILPAAGTFGNLGRGTFVGPGLADLDMSLFKTTAVSEKMSLQFRAEFFNVLNHPNFNSPNTTVFSSGTVSASAGLITATSTTSRQIQFGLKLIF